jgi:hypothetical protein
MKWDGHFMAIHESCCALGGSQDTAVSRAERRSSDDKGRVVAIDERSRIRPIDDHHGRQHCIGMFFSASLPEEVLAFEDAASRDAQISKLKVRKSVCMLRALGVGGVQSLLPCFSPLLALAHPFEQAIPAAAAAVLKARQEVEVRRLLYIARKLLMPVF